MRAVPAPNARGLDRIVRFALVGLAGFVVDAAVLGLLIRWAGMGPLAGRILSFAAAAGLTWWLNRQFTFRQSGAPSGGLRAELQLYLGASALGALINYLAFAVAVLAVPLFRDVPPLAVAVGSLAGAVFNYLAYSRFVFRAGRDTFPR